VTAGISTVHTVDIDRIEFLPNRRSFPQRGLVFCYTKVHFQAGRRLRIIYSSSLPVKLEGHNLARERREMAGRNRKLGQARGSKISFDQFASDGLRSSAEGDSGLDAVVVEDSAALGGDLIE
jgi:hypothetical protein